jgi:hypothetical protein
MRAAPISKSSADVQDLTRITTLSDLAVVAEAERVAEQAADRSHEVAGELATARAAVASGDRLLRYRLPELIEKAEIAQELAERTRRHADHVREAAAADVVHAQGPALEIILRRLADRWAAVDQEAQAALTLLNGVSAIVGPQRMGGLYDTIPAVFLPESRISESARGVWTHEMRKNGWAI